LKQGVRSATSHESGKRRKKKGKRRRPNQKRVQITNGGKKPERQDIFQISRAREIKKGRVPSISPRNKNSKGEKKKKNEQKEMRGKIHGRKKVAGGLVKAGFSQEPKTSKRKA